MTLVTASFVNLNKMCGYVQLETTHIILVLSQSLSRSTSALGRSDYIFELQGRRCRQLFLACPC